MDDKKAATDIVMMLIGPIAAIVFSIMRTAYDSDEPRVVRIALEAGVCAGITVTAMAAVLAATWQLPKLEIIGSVVRDLMSLQG